MLQRVRRGCLAIPPGGEKQLDLLGDGTLTRERTWKRRLLPFQEKVY
jgi:hypothetical protein